jgi:hypothetical protein
MTSSARLQQEADAARVGLSSALDELKSSVTTTALTNGAMTFAKEGSSAVAKAAVDRAIANPLAAMLIGAGVFMLMSTRKDGTSPLSDLVDSGKTAIKNAVGTAGETASMAAAAASDAVTGLAERASEQAQDAMARSQERGQGLTARGREQAHKLLEQGQSTFEQFAQEQPILVAALGVAVGAALGASLPLTRAEHDYLGEAARNAKAKGGKIAREVADAVTGKLAGDNPADKVGEVVETVSNTVVHGLKS